MSAWRAMFVLAGLLIVGGGWPHPRGTFEQMLTDPDWTIVHVLVTLGFVALFAGLWLLWRRGPLPPRTRMWLLFALVGTALQILEMVLHTAAVVDAENLVAGRPTPVFSTHLLMAILFYPVFGFTAAGLVLAGAKDRTLGSWWIAPLGVLGALAHALSAPLTLVLAIEWAGILFPMIMVFGLWAVLAGLWPVRAPVLRSAEPETALTP